MSNHSVVKILRIKNAVPIAALPSKRNIELKEVMKDVMPEFEVADNIIYTSFNNIRQSFIQQLCY